MACLLVESNTEGVIVEPVNNSMWARGMDVGDIILNNVKVPKENLVFEKSDITSENFHNAIGLCWGVLGAAEACYETARDYVMHRKQFDTPLSKNPIIQQKLTDMWTEITLGTHAAYRLSKLVDEGESPSDEAYMVKRNNARKSLEIARIARDMLGSNGTLDEYGVVRHMLNLESANTYAMTYDTISRIVGESIVR